jgi:ABC-type transport system involved in Fe-S cluster assembly fused permease/ATPase subunit
MISPSLIAHRLSSIQNADRIIAMSNGKIMEEGTYQELIVRSNYKPSAWVLKAYY